MQKTQAKPQTHLNYPFKGGYTDLETNAALQPSPKPAPFILGGWGGLATRLTICTIPTPGIKRAADTWARRVATNIRFPTLGSSSNQKTNKTKKQPTSKTFTPLHNVPAMLRSHSKYTRLEIVLIGFRKSCALFSHIPTQRTVSQGEQTCDGFVFFYLQNYIPHRAQTAKPSPAPEHSHKTQQSWASALGGCSTFTGFSNEFLLGEGHPFAKMLQSVTSVKWLMQNLKQNFSKSDTHNKNKNKKRPFFN